MMHTAVKKLKSTRGSGIAEALVGFLISVLSVITLLSVATTTLELIKQSDASILVLYAEEGAMDQFINGGEADSELGTEYTVYTNSGGGSSNFVIFAQGQINGATHSPSAEVKYYLTNRHRLFGFVPD